MADTIEGGDVLFRLLADPEEFDAVLDASLERLEEFGEQAEEVGEGLGEDIGGGATKATGALQGLGGRGFGGIAQAIKIVNPQLGKAVQTFGNLQKSVPKLAASLKALPAAMGPVGIAAIAVGAAFAAATAHTSALGRELDQLEADLEAHGNQVNKAGEISDNLDAEYKKLTESLAILRGEVTANEVSLTDYNREIDAQVSQQIELLDLSGKAARATVRRGEALKKLRAELVAEQEAQDDIAEGRRQEERAEQERRERQRQREQERLIALQEQMQAEAEAAQKKLEWEQQVADFLAEEEEKRADQQAALAEQQAADQEAIYGGISDTLSGVSDLSATLSQKMVEDNKKAAMALFRTSQAAAVSQIAINAAVAISKALAQLGPVAGAIAATGIGVTAGAQTAAVLAQPAPAHMGDPDAPDEARTPSGRRVMGAEAVIDSATYRRLGGEEGLRNLARGGGGQDISVSISYKNLDRAFARQARGTGRVSRTLARSSRLGKGRLGW